jgi:sec-independent protein translocase protein TatB
MFDFGFGFGEIIVLAIIALIVVGPKDLPRLAYKLGKFVSHIKSITAEFQNSVTQIVHNEEINALKQEMQKNLSFDDVLTQKQQLPLPIQRDNNIAPKP